MGRVAAELLFLRIDRILNREEVGDVVLDPVLSSASRPLPHRPRTQRAAIIGLGMGILLWSHGTDWPGSRGRQDA